MLDSDRTPNRAISDHLDLALRLANVFPAVVDLETGEIVGPSLWDEVVGNPPGTTPPRLSAWEAVINPGDRPARDASWDDCLAGRAPLYQAEYQVRRHDGRWVWIKVVGKVVERDAAGRPLRLAVAIRNIDDLRQAEQHCENASGSSTRSWGTFRGWPIGPWPTITGPPCSPAGAWKT